MSGWSSWIQIHSARFSLKARNWEQGNWRLAMASENEKWVISAMPDWLIQESLWEACLSDWGFMIQSTAKADLENACYTFVLYITEVDMVFSAMTKEILKAQVFKVRLWCHSPFQCRGNILTDAPCCLPVDDVLVFVAKKLDPHMFWDGDAWFCELLEIEHSLAEIDSTTCFCTIEFDPDVPPSIWRCCAIWWLRCVSKMHAMSMA